MLQQERLEHPQEAPRTPLVMAPQHILTPCHLCSASGDCFITLHPERSPKLPRSSCSSLLQQPPVYVPTWDTEVALGSLHPSSFGPRCPDLPVASPPPPSTSGCHWDISSCRKMRLAPRWVATRDGALHHCPLAPRTELLPRTNGSRDKKPGTPARGKAFDQL